MCDREEELFKFAANLEATDSIDPNFRPDIVTKELANIAIKWKTKAMENTRDYLAANCPQDELSGITVGDIRKRFSDIRKRFNITNTTGPCPDMGSDEQWAQYKCELRYKWADMMLIASKFASKQDDS